MNQPNRNDRERSRLNVPQRGVPRVINSSSQGIPVVNTPVAPTGTPPPKRPAPVAPPPATRPTPSVEAPKKVPQPKKKMPARARRITFSKTNIIIAGAILLVIIVSIVIIAGHHSGTSILKNTGYTTVLPKGKSITKLGGWQRISPPSSNPVYAYADNINGIAISVSEQPLPTSFKSDTDTQVANLAKAYNATDKIDASGTSVYIGTSVKGPQSVIFTKKNVLVLIKSQAKIGNDAWIAYAKSLN